jgi:hypothetical protein
VFDEIISAEIPFEDTPAYFNRLKTLGNKSALAAIINYH